jgi:hypothetical protein
MLGLVGDRPLFLKLIGAGGCGGGGGGGVLWPMFDSTTEGIGIDSSTGARRFLVR